MHCPVFDGFSLVGPKFFKQCNFLYQQYDVVKSFSTNQNTECRAVLNLDVHQHCILMYIIFIKHIGEKLNGLNLFKDSHQFFFCLQNSKMVQTTLT